MRIKTFLTNTEKPNKVLTYSIFLNKFSACCCCMCCCCMYSMPGPLCMFRCILCCISWSSWFCSPCRPSSCDTCPRLPPPCQPHCTPGPMPGPMPPQAVVTSATFKNLKPVETEVPRLQFQAGGASRKRVRRGRFWSHPQHRQPARCVVRPTSGLLPCWAPLPALLSRSGCRDTNSRIHPPGMPPPSSAR